MWLNGPTQWHNHKKGKKHKNNKKKQVAPVKCQENKNSGSGGSKPQGGALEAPQPQHMQGGILVEWCLLVVVGGIP